ncbi:hypothetical protein O1399_21955, partial [Bacteroides fragilis]|uniref:hypothetical protein n=1 Tax=Bacteroides fragilis TaxID=817 RepID=UPI0022AB1D4B
TCWEKEPVSFSGKRQEVKNEGHILVCRGLCRHGAPFYLQARKGCGDLERGGGPAGFPRGTPGGIPQDHL